MPRQAAPLLLLLAATSASALPPAGKYKVTQRSATLTGLATGSSVRVTAPDADGVYPLIPFMHGVYDNGYTAIQKTIASYGFVVVAPLGCIPLCTEEKWASDQMEIIDLVAKSKEDPAYAKANTSNVGIAGHSFGGIATVTNMHTQDARVRAAFALHPCQNAKSGTVDIPAAFVTGSKDTVCDQHGVYQYYKDSSPVTPHPATPPLYFANMKGLIHQDAENPPPLGGHWDKYVGQFFRCYLLGDAAACAQMDSGTSDTMCKANDMLEFQGTSQCFTPSNPCDPGKGMLC